MTTLAEMKEAEKIIQETIPKKNRYEKPLWQGVLDLIKKSDYGKKDAEVTMESPLPPGRNEIEEVMDGNFDGVQMKFLGICSSIFEGFGSVSMAPYTRGLGTRSMTISFVANK